MRHLCNIRIRIINLHIYLISIIVLLYIRDLSFIKNYRKKRDVFMKEKRKQLSAFALTALVLMMFFIFRFLGKEPSKYTPGTYMSAVSLNNQILYLDVTVDDNRITDISIDSRDEIIETIYPLIQPALDNISRQIYEKQSLDGITYDDSSRYTSKILLNAVQDALSKAQKQPE